LARNKCALESQAVAKPHASSCSAPENIPFKRTAAGIEFTIPGVTEYEVAAIT